MLKTSISLAIALVAGLSAGACAPRAMTLEDAYMIEQAQNARTTLRVSNNSWQDMNVFLLRGNTRMRLGMVTSMSTSQFTLPRDAVINGTDLRLYADPIGSIDGWVTQPLLIEPGQEVSLTLQNNLNLSSYSIF